MTCRFIHNDECSGSTLCCLQCRSCWWVPWEKKHLFRKTGREGGGWGGGELNSVCSGSESYQGSLHCIICSRARNSNITIPSLENLQGEIVILLSSLALNCSPSGTHLLWCHSEWNKNHKQWGWGSETHLYVSVQSTCYQFLQKIKKRTES